jgi:hypothetical protein
LRGHSSLSREGGSPSLLNVSLNRRCDCCPWPEQLSVAFQLPYPLSLIYAFSLPLFINNPLVMQGWTIQVCAEKTALIAFGKPFRPSTTAVTMSPQPQPPAISETTVQRGFNALILLFALAGHVSAETASNYDIIARLSQVFAGGGGADR